MKTFAHTNAAGDILAIGMIYFEDGRLTPEVAGYAADLGLESGILAYGEKVKPSADLTTIVIDTEEMPGGSGMRFDKTFRNAFKHAGGRRVDVDIPKAKEIAHERRRAARASEFAPLDVEATIPAKATQAEAKRQQVRDKYAVMQAAIDAATTADGIKAALIV